VTTPSAPTPASLSTLHPIQLSGLASDDDGAPVSGVTVFIFRWDVVGSPRSTVTTVTDASGRYSIGFNDVFGVSGSWPMLIRTEKNGYESDDRSIQDLPLSGSAGAVTTVVQDRCGTAHRLCHAGCHVE
jgi:hypothetical protein